MTLALEIPDEDTPSPNTVRLAELWLGAISTVRLPVPTSSGRWIDWIDYLRLWRVDLPFRANELAWLFDQTQLLNWNMGGRDCPVPGLYELLFTDEFPPEYWLSGFWLCVHLASCRQCRRICCKYHPEWAHCIREGWREPPSSLEAIVFGEAQRRIGQLWQQIAIRNNPPRAWPPEHPRE